MTKYRLILDGEWTFDPRRVNEVKAAIEVYLALHLRLKGDQIRCTWVYKPVGGRTEVDIESRLPKGRIRNLANGFDEIEYKGLSSSS